MFWFPKWNSRLSSAWPAAEGTDARLEAVADATQMPGYVEDKCGPVFGDLKLSVSISVSIPAHLPGRAAYASES